MVPLYNAWISSTPLTSIFLLDALYKRSDLALGDSSTFKLYLSTKLLPKIEGELPVSGIVLTRKAKL